MFNRLEDRKIKREGMGAQSGSSQTGDRNRRSRTRGVQRRFFCLEDRKIKREGMGAQLGSRQTECVPVKIPCCYFR